MPIDPERFEEVMGAVEPGDIKGLADAIGLLGMEICATYAEDWQGDSPDDILARGMIGSLRMVVDSMVEASKVATIQNKELSEVMVQLTVRQFSINAENLTALRRLGRLKREED